MRLESQDEAIDFADCFRIVGSFGIDLKITNLATDANAVLLHRAEMRAARNQRDVFTCAREHRAQEGSNRACADDRESHKELIECRRVVG